MKFTTLKSIVVALIVSSPISVMAVEPVSHSEGISNPIEAIVQIPVTGIRIVTGAVALPLMFVGEIGNISGQAGEALWEHANSVSSEPMHASDAKALVNSNESFL